MAKFHIKEDGNPGKCTAQEGNCPFGSDAPHFSTEADARTHFEHLQRVTGGSFASKQAGPDHSRIPPLISGAKESPGFYFVEGGIIDLSTQGAVVGEYDDPQDFHDAKDDYADVPVIGVHYTTETFNDDGKRLRTTEAYGFAAFEALQSAEEVKDIVASIIDTNASKEFNRYDSVCRYTWLDAHTRVTSEVTLHAAD